MAMTGTLPPHDEQHSQRRRFRLENNYLAVHEGSAQAGKRFAGTPFEHQTFWYVNDKYFGWWDAYEDQWARAIRGRLKPGQDTVVAKVTARLPEYGAHPPGLALFGACSLSFQEFDAFRSRCDFLRGINNGRSTVLLSLLVNAHTPTDSRRRTMCRRNNFSWITSLVYARTLYSEGTMTFLAVAAYALFISEKKRRLCPVC